MLILFIMIFTLSIFKLIYIKKEYLYLSTDYSVYVLIFMPFVIFYALKDVCDISSAVSLNWICTIPMSMYLYQSTHFYFKQYDILIVYSVMGIFVNLIVFKKAGIKEFILAVSGYIMLNILTVAGVVKEFVFGINGNNYEQYCVINILKNSDWFTASDNSGQYLDMLFSFSAQDRKKYFIAEKAAQYGIANVVIVFLLIVCAFILLLIKNYRKNNEAALIATGIMLMQSICFFLVNMGIVRGTVYEIPLLKKNIVYSICQLSLSAVALGIGGSIFNIVKKKCDGVAQKFLLLFK